MSTEKPEYIKDAFGRDIIVSTGDLRGSRDRSRSRDSSSESCSDADVFVEDEVVAEMGNRKSHKIRHESGDKRRERVHHSKHHNMLDKAERSIPHIPLPKTHPRRSFYQFMQKQSNDITPEEAHSIYTKEMSKYEEDISRKVFDAFKDEEWLQERYMPSMKRRRLRDRAIDVKKNHSRLCDYIASGAIMGENEKKEGVILSDQFSRRIVDDVYPACVFICNLPSSCSRQEFKSILTDIKGVSAIYFGDPLICPPPGLFRFVWLSMESMSAAEEAVSILDGSTREYMINPITKEKGRVQIACNLQQPFRRHKKICIAANSKENVIIDLKRLLKLLHVLETYWEIEKSMEPVLSLLQNLKPFVTDVDKVYILAFFIRRVFGYDYWRCTESEDFGMSLHKYSGDMIRSQGEIDEENESEVEKGKQFYEKLEEMTNLYMNKMEKSTVGKDICFVSEDLAKEMEIRECEKELMNELVKEEEGLFTCVACDKTFEAREFLDKHIFNNHRDKVEGVSVAKIMDQIMVDLYTKDKEKVIPIIIDAKINRSRY